MKKAFLTSLAFLAASAQAQRVSPENVLDLGQVQFYTPAEATFELTNTTSEPLVIDRVDTGCGCTTAQFDRDAIPPGEQYNITVAYDARTMGRFDRIIDVYPAAPGKPFAIELRGQVVETVERDMPVPTENPEQMLPEQIGELLADCNYVEFEDVHIGEVFQQRFRIYNPTGEVVQPQLMHLPAYITASVSPSRLRPGRTAEVTLTFDSTAGISEQDVGMIQNTIYLGKNPGENISPDKALIVAAVITPPIASEQDVDLTTAPHMVLSTDVVKTRASRLLRKPATLYITNTGLSTLDIRRIQTFTPGVQVSLETTQIPPGGTARMKVSVNHKDFRTSVATPRVLLVTNDPLLPTKFITIKDEN